MARFSRKEIENSIAALEAAERAYYLIATLPINHPERDGASQKALWEAATQCRATINEWHYEIPREKNASLRNDRP